MITDTVAKGLNDQINNELTASYSYLAMSAHLESSVYGGFTRWMRLQAEEEKKHAMKICSYLADRGGKIILGALDQPRSEYKSVKEIFDTALVIERRTTSQINQLYETASAEKDYTTVEFLGWFLTEQVEEEKIAENMVERVKLADGKINALIRLNYELAKRES